MTANSANGQVLVNGENNNGQADGSNGTAQPPGRKRLSLFGWRTPSVPSPPPLKSADISTKHPFDIPFHIDFSQFSFLLLAIKIVVLIYDIITFPFYALYQQPWTKRAANRHVRARLQDPNDPYSAYVRCDKPFLNHYVFKPETIPEFQQLAFKLNPRDKPILGTREMISVNQEVQRNGRSLSKYNLGDYKWLTIGQVDETIGKLSRAFLDRGVKFQERVLIFSETRMEWFLNAQALWRIGATVTTLFATLGHEGIIFGINETEVEHIVTTEDLLPKLLRIVDRIPKVRHIYVIEVHPGLLKFGKTTQADFDKATGEERKIQINMYKKMLEVGASTPEDKYEYTPPKPDDIAVILYTSGSTGNPKGVIQSHKNFVGAMRALYALLNEDILDDERHVYYGLLPLAHSLEMAAELVFFGAGVKIGYGTPYTMTDNGTAIMKGQKGDLRLLQPTIMAGVPLILDRIRKTITDRFEGKDPFWKQLFKYACAYKNFWIDHGYDTPLVNRFICKKVQGQMGGRVEYMIIGGAPLSPDTQRVMRAFLNVKLLIGYGSTETCAASCITDLDDMSIGQIGAPLYGVKLRLLDWPEGGYSVHDKPYPRGELVVGGDCVTKGYFKLPEQTEEAYEEKDGTKWFKMGDIGEIYENGSVKIIDRKKDLVKLQFGEYISLGKVEAELKNFRFVENVCVYGDSMHTYMIAFISPSIAALKRLAVEMNLGDKSLEAWCKDPEIIKQVTKELQEFGQEAGLNKMEIPQKIRLCHEEWSVKTGFLTASMKINRRNIQKFYADDIAKMYGK